MIIKTKRKKERKKERKKSQVPEAHACNPSYSGGLQFKASPRQIVHETLSQKYPTQKRAGGVAQGEGLSSNHSSTKRKGKNIHKFFAHRSLLNHTLFTTL
jgi:hypothetical protein